MSIKINTAALLLGSAFLLSACSGDGTASDQDETNQTVDENQTDTSTDNNEKTTSEDNSGEDRNADGGNEEDDGDKSSATDNDTSSENEDIQQQDYDSSEEAAAQIEGYEKVDHTNIDLGHGIKGLQEGAAGHEYLYWNEGRWLIKVDFPTDPQYKIDGYEGAEDLAKKVVDYLEKNYLPAPDDKGVITINGFKKHPETVVKWQEGKTVYTVTSKEKEPFDALERTVESE